MLTGKTTWRGSCSYLHTQKSTPVLLATLLTVSVHSHLQPLTCISVFFMLSIVQYSNFFQHTPFHMFVFISFSLQTLFSSLSLSHSLLPLSPCPSFLPFHNQSPCRKNDMTLKQPITFHQNT